MFTSSAVIFYQHLKYQPTMAAAESQSLWDSVDEAEGPVGSHHQSGSQSPQVKGGKEAKSNSDSKNLSILNPDEALHVERLDGKGDVSSDFLLLSLAYGVRFGKAVFYGGQEVLSNSALTFTLINLIHFVKNLEEISQAWKFSYVPHLIPLDEPGAFVAVIVVRKNHIKFIRIRNPKLVPTKYVTFKDSEAIPMTLKGIKY